jgi:hypothetical protein
MGDRLNEVDDAKRRHQILVDATRDELPIENDVIQLAQNNHLSPRVAILREFFELLEQRVSTLRRL